MAAKFKTKKMYESFIVVEGRGTFPMDMLRYDRCFPASELDSSIANMDGHRALILCRRSESSPDPTKGRWNSFGWDVIETYVESAAAVIHRSVRNQQCGRTF